MSRPILCAFCLPLLLGLSCNPNRIDGGECLPEERGCDPGGGGGGPGPTPGPGGPERIDKVGPGQGTPFDPRDGSVGVKKDDKGNIVLDPGNFAGMKPIIWVASSGAGTVSKIDTRTMKEVARYYSAPDGRGDPSRTSVGLNGDVVVANRGGGSAVYIFGDESSCVDKNGNGKIDTSRGAGPGAVLPWGQDECVRWFTDLRVNGATPYPRGVAFDAGGEVGGINVYIGLYSTGEVLRLSAADGKILKRIKVEGNPYGLVIDSEGGVVVQGSGPISRIDPKKGDAITSLGRSPCPYGIAADSRGYIYTAGNSGASGCVARVKYSGGPWETLNLASQGATFPRGLAVDQKNQVWITDTTYGMFHVDASGPMMVHKGKARLNSSYSVGAAIDFDGNPWIISHANSTAYKVDPKSDPQNYTTSGVSVGNAPYTYSDMTGYQLRNAVGAGTYRHTFNGCGPDTRWFDLSWEITTPAATEVTVRVRFGGTQAELAAAAFVQVAKVPPDKAPVKLSPPPGVKPALLQVEISMKSADSKITPILSGLGASYSCNILG